MPHCRQARRFRSARHFSCAMLALCLLAFCLPQRHADAATTQYVYDELGRLVQATRSDGAVIQYQYDANGNLLAVNRINAGGLAIATFAPSITHATSTVIISGTGFSPTPGANAVTVGGAPATVTAATPTQLTISVPSRRFLRSKRISTKSGAQFFDRRTSTYRCEQGSRNLNRHKQRYCQLQS